MRRIVDEPPTMAPQRHRFARSSSHEGNTLNQIENTDTSKL